MPSEELAALHLAATRLLQKGAPAITITHLAVPQPHQAGRSTALDLYSIWFTVHHTHSYNIVPPRFCLRSLSVNLLFLARDTSGTSTGDSPSRTYRLYTVHEHNLAAARRSSQRRTPSPSYDPCQGVRASLHFGHAQPPYPPLGSLTLRTTRRGGARLHPLGLEGHPHGEVTSRRWRTAHWPTAANSCCK